MLSTIAIQPPLAFSRNEMMMNYPKEKHDASNEIFAILIIRQVSFTVETRFDEKQHENIKNIYLRKVTRKNYFRGLRRLTSDSKFIVIK